MESVDLFVVSNIVQFQVDDKEHKDHWKKELMAHRMELDFSKGRAQVIWIVLR
jgi:hypothetical protein